MKVRDISAVVYGVAGGRAVCTVQPRGPSASSARAAPEIAPIGEASHPLAGMVKVTEPGSTAATLLP